MFRPRHLASFICAAALAAAGLAQGSVGTKSGARHSDTPGSQRGQLPTPAATRHLPQTAVEVETAVPTGLRVDDIDDVDGIDGIDDIDGIDWVARIDARLSTVGLRKHRPSARQRGAQAKALRRRLSSVLGHDLEPGNIAVHVRDLESGAVLFDQRGEQHLNPASNQKILTAHAASELLGSDYRFETRVLRHGDALYLVGEGDPTLKLRNLHELVAQLQGQGSAALAGVKRIVVDTSAFSARRFAPGLNPASGESAYLAPTGALSLNFNTVEVHVRPGLAPGAPVRVSVFPPSAQVEIRNHARTDVGELHVDSFAQRDPKHAELGERTVVEIAGALSPHADVQKFRRRIHDPARFSGQAFAHALADLRPQAADLPVELGVAPDGARTLASHNSAPLVQVLASPMRYSNNFATEQVLRTLAWRATGRPGDWDAGHEVLAAFANQVVHDPKAFEFENGSGLSRSGRTTPSALVDLVALSDDDGSASADLLSSYAGFGREGTLAHRVPAARGRVRAKTGTLAGVSALSGVASSADGSQRLGFSILVNGRHAGESRATQDQLVAAMLAWLDGR